MSLKIGNHAKRKHNAQPAHTPYTPFAEGVTAPLVSNDMFVSTPDPYSAAITEATAQQEFNPYAGFDTPMEFPSTPQVTIDNPYSALGAVNASRPGESGFGSVNAKGTKGYEGYRDRVYTDTTGNATIGYGHKLTQAEIKSGKYANGITPEQGEALYAQDRAKHTAQFYKREPWAKDLSPSQREALEDMSFNMGPAFLDKFSKNRLLMQQGDFHAAASGFERSKYARQVGQRAYDNAARLRM